MGPFSYILDKPLERLHSRVPGLYVDLLTKVFIPVDPAQEEFRIDCRILMIQPGSQDRYHFHKKTVNLFTVVEGQTDVQLNDRWVRLTGGESVVVDVLDKHCFRACSDRPCVLTETRLNVHEDDVFYVDEQEAQGKSSTRFSQEW